MVAVAAVVGCSSGNNAVGVSLVSTGAASTWNGTWVDSTAGTSGTLGLALAVNAATSVATGTLTFGGNSTSFFGGPPPAPTPLSGTFNPQSWIVNQTGTPYGDVSVTWGQSYYVGKITGSVTNISNPAIQRVDFTGLANSGNITLSLALTLAQTTGTPPVHVIQYGSATLNKAS